METETNTQTETDVKTGTTRNPHGLPCSETICKFENERGCKMTDIRFSFDGAKESYVQRLKDLYKEVKDLDVVRRETRGHKGVTYVELDVHDNLYLEFVDGAWMTIYIHNHQYNRCSNRILNI